MIGRPVSDACYLVCIAAGQTRIVNKYPADDAAEVQQILEEKLTPWCRSYWIIEQATGKRVSAEELQ